MKVESGTGTVARSWAAGRSAAKYPTVAATAVPRKAAPAMKRPLSAPAKGPTRRPTFTRRDIRPFTCG